MKSQNFWAIISLLGGTLLCLIGIGLVVAYILEAVFARWGESDQSLLFWYLPFLLFGIIGLVTGLSLAILGKKKIKNN